MLFLEAAVVLPPGAPWWAGALAALAASPGLASLAAAWLQHRAKKAEPTKDTALEARVKFLEDNEPANVAAVRETAAAALAAASAAAATANAAAATANATGADLKHHLEDEQRRRDAAREIGQKRDERLAEKVEKLGEKVTTLTAQTELLLDGKVDTGGGSRRGR